MDSIVINSTVMTAKPAVTVMIASALRISGLSSFLGGKGVGIGSVCLPGSSLRPNRM